MDAPNFYKICIFSIEILEISKFSPAAQDKLFSNSFIGNCTLYYNCFKISIVPLRPIE